MVKAIFTRVDPVLNVEGTLLTEQAAEKFWTHVRAMAQRLGTEPPKHIIAGIDDNFFVTENPVTLNGTRLEGSYAVRQLLAAEVHGEARSRCRSRARTGALQWRRHYVYQEDVAGPHALRGVSVGALCRRTLVAAAVPLHASVLAAVSAVIQQNEPAAGVQGRRHRGRGDVAVAHGTGAAEGDRLCELSLAGGAGALFTERQGREPGDCRTYCHRLRHVCDLVQPARRSYRHRFSTSDGRPPEAGCPAGRRSSPDRAVALSKYAGTAGRRIVARRHRERRGDRSRNVAGLRTAVRSGARGGSRLALSAFVR